MDLGLRGSGVLLIGGTRGIGREAARLLGAEGARVALIARDPAALAETAREIEERGGQAAVFPADVTDPEGAPRAVGAAAEALGPFDAMIHAAGRGFRGPVLEIPDATWREAFELNLLAVVRTIRTAAPHLRRGARVVVVGAASAKQPHYRQGPSNVAKAALANLTTGLAEELAPDLIVNCVAPGRILTDRRRDRAEAGGRAAGTPLADRLREEAAGVPLGRLGEPREVAGIVVFFASPWASYTTGQSIIVDGGLVRSV